MAFSHGSSAVLLSGGYDISGYLKSVSTDGGREVNDTSTLGATSRTFYGGLGMATVNSEGLFDGDSVGPPEAIDYILYNALGTESGVLYFPTGSTLGNPALGLHGVQGAYAITSPVEDMVAISLSIASNHGYERGISLQSHTSAVTTSGNGSSYDSGIVGGTALGGTGFLQVIAHSGTTPTITVKIQDSANDSTWADLVTFTQVGDTIATERIELGATDQVDRYLRVLYTIAGSSPSYTFAAAFHRNEPITP